MDRIEYKEGVIWCGEEKASNQLSTLVVTNWKNRKRNVRFNKSIHAIL